MYALYTVYISRNCFLVVVDGGMRGTKSPDRLIFTVVNVYILVSMFKDETYKY